MEFVDDDELKIFEDFGPFGVMGQDAGMQHVGVGEDDVGPLSNGAAGVLRGVAIVGEGPDFWDLAVDAHGVNGGLELLQLILCEGLGGEEIHGAGGGIGKEAIEDGEVVAEGFAAGGGGDDDDVAAFGDFGIGGGLVAVELLDATGMEGRGEAGGDGFGNGGKVAFAGRLMLNGADGRIWLRHPFAEPIDGAIEPGGAAEGEAGIVLFGPCRIRKAKGEIHRARFRFFFATTPLQETQQVDLGAAEELVPFQSRGDGKRRPGGNAFPFIHANHLAHATQPNANLTAGGGQGDHVFDRIAFLQSSFGGE